MIAANIVSMPQAAFMSVGLTGGVSTQLHEYMNKYNNIVANSTPQGATIVEHGRKVFSHVIGDKVIEEAKVKFKETTDTVISDDEIYNLTPGRYESANKIMDEIVMANPEIVKRFEENTINAYSEYEYTMNSIQLEDMYHTVVANVGSSDDYDEYTYISESSDPDGYDAYTTTERDIIRNVWRDSNVALKDGIDPVTGESI